MTDSLPFRLTFSTCFRYVVGAFVVGLLVGYLVAALVR